MKGSTHLALGTAIGIAGAAYFPFTFKDSLILIAVASFSSLSADLDGTSILTSRLSQFTKRIRNIGLWAGIAMLLGLVYLYLASRNFYPEYTLICFMLLLASFLTRNGRIRNLSVSAVGAAVLIAGWQSHIYGFVWLGIFILIAPWLKHRGMTHTIWAVLFWGAMGSQLQQDLQIEGLMAVSTTSYLSHLIADTLTPQGVKWLYPVFKKSIKLPIL